MPVRTLRNEDGQFVITDVIEMLCQEMFYFHASHEQKTAALDLVSACRWGESRDVMVAAERAGFDPKEVEPKREVGAPHSASSASAAGAGSASRVLARMSTDEELESLRKRNQVLELRKSLAEKEAALRHSAGADTAGAQESVRRPDPPRIHEDHLRALKSALPPAAMQPVQLRGASASGTSQPEAGSAKEAAKLDKFTMSEIAECTWSATLAKLEGKQPHASAVQEALSAFSKSMGEHMTPGSGSVKNPSGQSGAEEEVLAQRRKVEEEVEAHRLWAHQLEVQKRQEEEALARAEVQQRQEEEALAQRRKAEEEAEAHRLWAQQVEVQQRQEEEAVAWGEVQRRKEEEALAWAQAQKRQEEEALAWAEVQRKKEEEEALAWAETQKRQGEALAWQAEQARAEADLRELEMQKRSLETEIKAAAEAQMQRREQEMEAEAQARIKAEARKATEEREQQELLAELTALRMQKLQLEQEVRVSAEIAEEREQQNEMNTEESQEEDEAEERAGKRARNM